MRRDLGHQREAFTGYAAGGVGVPGNHEDGVMALPAGAFPAFGLSGLAWSCSLTTMAFSVDWRGLRRRREYMEPVSVALLLKDLDAPAGEALERVQSAVAAMPTSPSTGFPEVIVTLSSRGLVVIAEGVVEVAEWVELLCDALSGTGISGRMAAASSQWPPPRSSPSSFWPQAAALVAYRLSTPWSLTAWGGHRPGWGLDESVTSAVTRHAAHWLSAITGDTFARQDLFSMRVDAADVEHLLRFALDHGQHANATTVQRRPDERTIVDLSWHGQAAYQHCAQTQPKSNVLQRLKEAVLLAPEDVDWAIIRHVAGPPCDWGGGQFCRYPSPPHIFESSWSRHRHLWATHVPDVYGVQLLTAAHLDRGHNLSDWNITQVSPNRWLVEAKDLATWLGPTTTEEMVSGLWPPPEVLTRARSDFGAMIATQPVLDNNPPPQQQQ